MHYLKATGKGEDVLRKASSLSLVYHFAILFIQVTLQGKGFQGLISSMIISAIIDFIVITIYARANDTTQVILKWIADVCFNAVLTKYASPVSSSTSKTRIDYEVERTRKNSHQPKRTPFVEITTRKKIEHWNS